MRAAGSPDIYPNLGKFNISYALYPHEGDWKSGVWAEGEDFNVPVYASEPPSMALVSEHAIHPEEASFISIDDPGVIISGLKQSEDGDELIIRLAEMFGKETIVNLKIPVKARAVRRLNFVELPIPEPIQPSFEGEVIQFKIKPHEIVTLGILPF